MDKASILSLHYPSNADHPAKIAQFIACNFIDLLKQFIPALVGYTKQFKLLILVWHSLDAQIATLYALDHAYSIIEIAIGNIHYRHWQPNTHLSMFTKM